MSNASTNTPAVSLDELLALNDEIAALLRAGVPLERGLSLLGRDAAGRRGELARELAEHLEKGESLSQAIAASKHQYPPLYAAVVQAGVKSGRLAVALEGLAVVGRNLTELRRLISISLAYPLGVLLLVYGLCVFFVLVLAPRLAQIELFPLWARQFLASIAALSSSIHIWGPAVPLAVILLFAFWWIASSRALVVQPRMAGVLLAWVPGVRRMLLWSQTATFAEVLGLLIEHNVPLDEAVTLSAAATGDRKLRSSAARMADQIRAGQPLVEISPRSSAIPPLLMWLVTANTPQAAIVGGLKDAAQNYRQRAIYRSELLKIYMPIVMSALIGGTATLAYAMLLFVPWVSLLHEISQP